MRRLTSRDSLILVLVVLVATVLRALVAYNGSLWADEGSFLNVIAASSWGEMINFLRLHESHPPLFYALMRLWSQVAGGSDTSLMILPLILSVILVPAIYFAGRALFSERIALFAASMAAVAPQLIEHSAQIRPYGLLFLAAFGSAVSLVACLTSDTRRAWSVYVLATVIMMYTHNWAWPIIVGELTTVLIYLRRVDEAHRRSLLRRGIIAWCVIIALYAPWIPTFMYQTGHAGHGSLPIDDGVEYFGYWIFASFRILESLVIGRLAAREPVAVVELIVGILALITVMRVYRNGSPSRAQLDRNDTLYRIRASLTFRIAAFAILAALIVSPLSNLILPRGLATVMPMVILAAAWWLDRLLSRKGSAAEARTAAIAFSVVLVAGIFETRALLIRPRSNMERVVSQITASARPNDLVILAPEWFAASFDHYFPPTYEQIDYPYDGRSGMINFSDTWETRSKMFAFDGLKTRMENAKRNNRRVWFVFERRYTRTYTPHELDKAYRHKLTGIFSVQEVKRIRTALEALYGNPSRVVEAKDPLPINDEIIAYLYGS